MKFSLSTVFLASVLTASVTAAPVVEIVERSPAYFTKLVQKTATCQLITVTPFELGFQITTGGWNDKWDRGLLDNLRGQCGAISDWVANPTEGNDQYYVSFHTSVLIRNHCVEDAIYLASGGLEGITCTRAFAQFS